jgi:hypothetical protein
MRRISFTLDFPAGTSEDDMTSHAIGFADHVRRDILAPSNDPKQPDVTTKIYRQVWEEIPE